MTGDAGDPFDVTDALDAIGRAAAAARDAYENVRDLPVVGPARAADLREHLAAMYSFERPLDATAVTDDVVAMLRRGSVHVTHPAYFGLFNPSVLPEAIAASTLVGAFNPQTAAWTHNPAAFEMERHALRWLAGRIGWDPASLSAHFCSGGQEANTTAVAVALTRAFPEVRERGVRALPGEPRILVSAEAHHSFEKAAHVCGLGRGAVVRVAVDDRLRMDVTALAAAIRAERDAGRLPFLVVGTAGTTSSGAIDPLDAVAQVCERERIWFHADAAWGGGALLSSRLRSVLAGIERSDSVTWDGHKWLAAPLGTGMFLTRHADAAVATFATDSAYMPAARGGVVDPANASHQWSRRAAGLPLFVALATRGAPGFERLVDRMTAMGDLLRDKLRAAGWTVVNDTPLPLVNFTRAPYDTDPRALGDLVRRIHLRGRAWVSPTALSLRAKPASRSGTVPARTTPVDAKSSLRAPSLADSEHDGRRVLRACITSYRTDERDLDTLVEELRAAASVTGGNDDDA